MVYQEDQDSTRNLPGICHESARNPGGFLLKSWEILYFIILLQVILIPTRIHQESTRNPTKVLGNIIFYHCPPIHTCYNFSFSRCNSCSHVPTCQAHTCRLAMLLHSYLTHHLYNHTASYTHMSLTCTSASPQLCTLPHVLRPHPDILTRSLTHANSSKHSYQVISRLTAYAE